MSERRGPSTLVRTPSTCTSNCSRVVPSNTVRPTPCIPASISETDIRGVAAGRGTNAAATRATAAVSFISTLDHHTVKPRTDEWN